MSGGGAAAAAAATKLRGYDFWRKVCGEVKYVVAPMVEASELPWRLLSRRHNAHLAFTPMFHSGNFAMSEKYRQREFSTCPEDRPLFVQFCGDDPETLLQAARFIENQCDAVDINLGCPQNIAKKGHYGAFLQDEWELIERIVSHLDKNLSIPVTCKIRVFPEVQKTIDYAKMLEKAGCSVLTVHGRLREQKGANTGLADWEKIRLVKEAVSIPVIANGNILYFEDIQRCLERTGVDAVMTAEGNLYNPALFSGRNPPIWELSQEYIDICKQYPPGSFGSLKGHLFKIWHPVLKHHEEFRPLIGSARSLEDMEAVTQKLAEKVKKELGDIEYEGELQEDNVAEEGTEVEITSSQYYKNIPYWRAQPLVRPLPTEQIASIWAAKDNKHRMGFLQQQAVKKRKEEKLQEAALHKLPTGVPTKSELPTAGTSTGDHDNTETTKRKIDCVDCEEDKGL